MPSTDTAPTMTPAQLRAAGTRLLGFYLGVGGVKVDAMADPSHFVTKTATGEYLAAGPLVTGLAGDPATYNAGIYPRVAAPGSVDHDFKTNDATFGARTAFTVTAGSNFGLGTISPAARFHAKSVGEITRLETTTARGGGGNYMTFADPTGVAASVGYAGSDSSFSISNNLNADLHFRTSGAIRMVIGSGASTFAVWSGADNAYSLGISGNRWSVLHAATGTINTCDVRLKFYRDESAPNAAEHAAALECFAVFGFFQHLDAREREAAGGVPARWHFGPKAQEVWTIFASHGLAAPLGEDGLPPEGSVPPAFLCFDTWGEETAPILAWWKPSAILGPDGEPVMVPCAEGEEGTEQRPTGETYVTREAGNIFGVRIDQLQSLMLVALNKERVAQAAVIADLSDRVAALEPAA